MRHCFVTLLLTVVLLLGGCAFQRTQQESPRRPADVRAEIVRLMPTSAGDREGWAVDIQAAFAAQNIAPTTSNLCAVLAVAEQESGLRVDPVVAGLAKIARQEIDRRAAAKHVPGFLVDAALWLKSPDGRRYSERLAAARTEKQLSGIFQDFIGMVPLGKRLFGGLNPVHTGGPMQVSIAFAEAHAQGYPYPVQGSIRDEVFSRRGGIYFGVVHLLGYPADYTQPLYRFADFNAGWYASRNAAFQHAVSVASGIPLALDGDLVQPDAGFGDPPGATELAVRSLAAQLDMSDSAIHRALGQGERQDFADTKLYARVFALADEIERKPLPRAVLPGITLKSPKITRKLTTAWFAKRVDDRWQRCMGRAG
ncbi:DUF1615 domain-containing protein [Rhodanobacter glycinis]|uniref:DUF1615 domain-containing protein n=2 Tax=Rhodanobacter glycinis TaxID=582702 RepID=A0A502BVQ8_9GAMM|nr:DUF1615 domain-containing protein [Rhodanobacter glycinis]TPG04987.1 DUF1615 domain-containing protein [Rhodanobacter glycinis]TPG50350.1 DUF1615 domain-containing protein [Rhodanobacter glycinis]